MAIHIAYSTRASFFTLFSFWLASLPDDITVSSPTLGITWESDCEPLQAEGESG